jgi:hypothetical protein
VIDYGRENGSVSWRASESGSDSSSSGYPPKPSSLRHCVSASIDSSRSPARRAVLPPAPARHLHRLRRRFVRAAGRRRSRPRLLPRRRPRSDTRPAAALPRRRRSRSPLLYSPVGASAHRQHAGIKPHREQPLLLLIREIHQFAELTDDLLRDRVRPLRRLHRNLVTSVAESA